MYREYFGLKLKPFSITPDPKFLYMSPAHKEALSHLVYGIKEGSGFVVITGEVGTGKTTILNAFLLRLPPRMPKVVIKNPHLKPENLYYLLGEAIGMPEEKRTRDYIHEYEERLKTTGGVVLIVDEAQGLTMEMLEEIRLLSNLETTHEKLVQIMLLGQQELNEKLNSPQLRQLKQRIGVKYHIPPLDSNETKDYIDHRLRVAGYEPMEEPLFTTSSLGEIYRYTRGFPRLINIVCDNVLLACYSDDTKQVSSNVVKKVAGDLEKTYGKNGAQTSGALQYNTYLRGPATWFIFGILFVFTLLAMAWVFFPHMDIPLSGGGTDKHHDSLLVAGSLPGRSGKSLPEPDANAVPQGPKITLSDQSGETDMPIPPSLSEPLRNNNSSVTVTIGAGDTVAQLATKHYGRIDSDIISAVRKANPSIPNIDLVYRGQKVVLPVIQDMARVMFTVSVASYHSINEATAVFVDLVKKGFQATIYPYLDNQGNTWYRITIGTFTNQENAKNHAQELKTKGFLYAKPVKVSLEG
jgi:type II secretory pathway predicted ATPase ExeA/phage tail protein X